MEAESLYVSFHQLIECEPDLENIVLTKETHLWLGKVQALVTEVGDVNAIVRINMEIERLIQHAGHYGFSIDTRQDAARNIRAVLYRCLAQAELKAPAAARGGFIPVGNSFDALSTISKLLNEATSDILIIDPYLDEKVLTDFAILAKDGILIRLLADASGYKQSLIPVFNAWKQQYGSARLTELKLATPRTLHDRLIIIDQSTVWILTQSLKDFAARSPATISKMHHDPSLKIRAYEDIWQSSSPV